MFHFLRAFLYAEVDSHQQQQTGKQRSRHTFQSKTDVCAGVASKTIL